MAAKLNKRDPKLLALKDAIFENGKDKDVTKGINQSFFKYNRNGIENVSLSFATKLTDSEVDWAFELVKENMEEVYDVSGYGWDDDDKRNELVEDGARFLLIKNDVTDKLIGFAHFRFTVQGEIMETMTGELSLHLWDIHIDEEYQRKGLGKHILLILELIARQQKMEVLSVPVQLMDDVTINWISKVKGFGPDTKLHELLKFDPEMEGFEVYAKYFNTPKPIAQSMPAAATMSTQYSSPVAKDVVSESVTPSQSTLDELSRSTAIVKKNIDFLLASQSHDENLKPAVNIDIITKGNESKSALTLTEDDIATLQDTLQDLQGLYFQKHGREPTEDEMSQWIDVLSGPDGKEHIRLQQSLQEMKSAVTTATSAADDIENTDCDKLKGFNALSLDEATK